MAATSLDAGRTGLRISSRLPKSRRLSLKRLINPLFDRKNADSRTLTVGCIRILYSRVPEESVVGQVPLQVGFAVGRIVGNAVARNRVKRLLRDEYRKNQTALVEACGSQDGMLVLMIVVSRAQSDESALRKDLAEAVRRLCQVEARETDPKRSDSTSTGLP